MQKKMADEFMLLERISSGDQTAFSQLFKFYKNKVFGYALPVLKSTAYAEEVVQETFIRLWVKRAHLVSIDNFSAYLRVMVRNQTLNTLKKISIEQHNQQLATLWNNELDFSPEDIIQFRETSAMLKSAIALVSRN